MKDKKFPLRFAHRGLVQHAPENTIEAFRAAVDFGCEGIELDIRLTKDGDAIVLHDANLARMTDGALTGDVWEYTVQELKNADIPYAAHLLRYDPPVPYSESRGSVAYYTEEETAKLRAEDKRVTHLVTFAEFDKWFETVVGDIIIEIEFCSLGLMKPVYEVLAQSKNCGRYILFSGDRKINDEIQSVIREKGKPDGLRLGANIRQVDEETMDFVNGADLYEVGLNDKKFTADDVKMLAERGIKVFSNLGDYPEWWQAMPELGVVAFKTNYAEAYTDWLKELAVN